MKNMNPALCLAECGCSFPDKFLTRKSKTHLNSQCFVSDFGIFPIPIRTSGLHGCRSGAWAGAEASPTGI